MSDEETREVGDLIINPEAGVHLIVDIVSDDDGGAGVITVNARCNGKFYGPLSGHVVLRPTPGLVHWLRFRRVR